MNRKKRHLHSLSLKNIFFKQFNEKNLDNPHFFYKLKQDKKNPTYNGGEMKKIKKTALDLLDDLYSLAYWMTGSEELSQELVYSTYLSADTGTEEGLLLKTFRQCYVARFGQKTDFCKTEKPGCSHPQIMGSLMQWAADIKLSVLLSEISGMKHGQISEIVGKPVETIRLWLFWGRKLLSTTNLAEMGRLKAS